MDRAINELRAELARTPDDPVLLGRLGALYYRRGDLVEAEKQYRKAIALAPRRPSLYNNLGNILCDMGRMEDGIAMYEHVIAMEKLDDPQRGPSPEALANLDLARLEYRMVHERIEYLERACQLDVSSSESYNALGCGYLLRGHRDKALEAFRRAGARNPRNPICGRNIAFTHTLNTTGVADLTSAVSEVAEAIARFPGEGRLHIHWGELLENAGLLDEAEERYLRALQADTRLLEAYDLLGRLREALGYGDAKDDATRTVEQTLQRLEDQAMERNEAEGGNSGSALYDLAFATVARARFLRRPLVSLAELDAKLRMAAQPDNSDSGSGVPLQAALLRAHLLETDGRRLEARVVLDNLPESLECARLWFERGGLALRSGDIGSALNSFDRATLCEPQDAVAYHSLRFAFEGHRRYTTERVRFESATAVNPKSGLAHQHMALAALSVLKDDEALFHFSRALELDPKLADASSGRGRALQRLGHLDEAEAAFEKALEIEPEHGDAKRHLAALRAQKLTRMMNRK